MATDDLLNELVARVGEGLGSAGEDRREFLEGLQLLQQGRADLASRRFRRAARRCEGPFETLSRFGQARCELLQGREGSALRVLRELVESNAPGPVRRVVWMEIAALAKRRGDQCLWESARRGMEACKKE
jgi:hypothetical protein